MPLPKVLFLSAPNALRGTIWTWYGWKTSSNCFIYSEGYTFNLVLFILRQNMIYGLHRRTIRRIQVRTECFRRRFPSKSSRRAIYRSDRIEEWQLISLGEAMTISSLLLPLWGSFDSGRTVWDLRRLYPIKQIHGSRHVINFSVLPLGRSTISIKNDPFEFKGPIYRRED